MRTPDDLVAVFRASGRKVTPQRERIFRILHESGTHPSADAVHAALVEDMPSVSLRTVYSTLHELAEMGELVQLDLGTGSARFDPNTGDHNHLVCDRCGAVQDISDDFPGVALASDNRFGFEVDSTDIIFRGRCRACAASRSTDAYPGPTSSRPHSNQENPPDV